MILFNVKDNLGFIWVNAKTTRTRRQLQIALTMLEILFGYSYRYCFILQELQYALANRSQVFQLGIWRQL